jgi:hypothetical protein
MHELTSHLWKGGDSDPERRSNALIGAALEGWRSTQTNLFQRRPELRIPWHEIICH